MSIEGGVSGRQQRLVCPNCGRIFFAWRPDDLPGVKVKCYFCRHEFADEAALRPPAPPPAAPPETPLTDAAAGQTPPGPAPNPPPAAPEPSGSRSPS